MEITIAYIYPDLLNLYGDRGNILTLKKRLEYRGIAVNVDEYFTDDKIDFDKTDILYIGAGSERSEEIALASLMRQKEEIKEYAENGGVILAVCSGYEFLGKYIKTLNGKKDALGIVDMYTQYSKKRFIGDVVLQSENFGTIAGFENRFGEIKSNAITPLGKVIHSKSQRKDFEGVIFKNVVGTHLHGPILPKNPSLADFLIKSAIERKYNDFNLESLDDTLEINANQYILDMFK